MDDLRMPGNSKRDEGKSFGNSAGLILRTSDQNAHTANAKAIDMLVGRTSYPYIVAWGKFLGFTPQTIQLEIHHAALDNAPTNSIQKLKGEWRTIDDIVNFENRCKVIDIADSV